jgi:hypothetical protein
MQNFRAERSKWSNCKESLCGFICEPSPSRHSSSLESRSERKQGASLFSDSSTSCSSSSSRGPMPLQCAQSERRSPPCGGRAMNRSHSDDHKNNNAGRLGQLQNPLRSGRNTNTRVLPPSRSNSTAPATRAAPQRSRSSGGTRSTSQVADARFSRPERSRWTVHGPGQQLYGSPLR